MSNKRKRSLFASPYTGNIMKLTTLTLTLALALLAAVFTTGAAAPRDRKDGDGKKMLEKQATRLAEDMKLDEATTAWFKPIYVAMQDSLRSVRRSVQTARKDGDTEKAATVSTNKLTELQAAALIEDRFAATEKEVAIKRAFYKQLRERLTSVQLVRLFAAQPPQGDRRNGNGPGNQQRTAGGFPGMGGPGGGFGGEDF